MSSRRRFDDNSSSDDSPPRPSSQRETPKPAPKTAPRSAVKATPVVTPSTNSKMYASGYKEKVDYSNSKEVHKCLEDLDNVISKRKMELSSIQRSSAISGGHRRKLARTTESPMKTARNLDKDLSLVAEREGTDSVNNNNDKENTQQPTVSTDVEDTTNVPTESKEDKGNDADHSDHESISSISSKGSGAVSVVDITGPISTLPTVHTNNGSPSQLEPSPPLSTSPVQGFVEERDEAVQVATLNESFEGDTSHQADTQDSSPEVSAFQTVPESLESPPKYTFGATGRVLVPSNIESISLPSSSVNNSSFASEAVLSDDDAALPSNTVVPMDSTGHTPKHIAATATSSSSSTSSPASIGSRSDEDEDGADGEADHDDSDNIIDESDLPDNSRVVHPETYTVDNVHDQMDVEHCTVQFGHTRYDNVHLRIDSVADLGFSPATKKVPEGLLQLEDGAVASGAGPDDNFGIAMVDVVEVDTSEKEDEVSPHGGVLNESTVSVDSVTSRSSRSSRGSASKRGSSGAGVEEEFLLGKSNESSPTQTTNTSAAAVVTPLTTVKSVSSSNSRHKPPSGGKSAVSSSSSASSSSRKKLQFSGSKTEHDDPADLATDGYDGEHEAMVDLDASQLHHSTNLSGVDLDLSVLSGTSPNTSALSRKASFLECEAKLLKRHLSVYQVKNALLKEEVLQITAMSEQKFQEVLQHMQRVEEERDRAKKDRSAAQEELVAEQEELLFVRGQLQSKSARLVDLEAELLASQRLLGALQKEVKIWRSQPPTPNSNTPTNAANAAPNGNESKSSGKRVHFRFSPPTNGGAPGEELAAMEPFQAILFLLDQLEPSHSHEKDRLQTFLRNSQRERISLESQVSDLDHKLQSSEAQGQVWKGKADDLDRAELEVGRMALEMETIQEQLLVACQERDQLLSDVQQLREALDAKEQALQELEAKHQLFVQDYQQMQHILTDMQHAMTTKDSELVAVQDAAQAALHTLQEEHQQQLKNQQAHVVLVAKESDLATINKDGKQAIVAAAPQMRHLYAKPSVYIVKSTGFTCTLFAVLVLQLVILALLLLYLQVNFQMIMLTDNEDIIERLLRFRSTY